MNGDQRDEVEVRAEAILADVYTALSYAEHFDAQMHLAKLKAQMYRVKLRRLLTSLRVLRRKGVILLAASLAFWALLGYAAFVAATAG